MNFQRYSILKVYSNYGYIFFGFVNCLYSRTACDDDKEYNLINYHKSALNLLCN